MYPTPNPHTPTQSMIHFNLASLFTSCDKKKTTKKTLSTSSIHRIVVNVVYENLSVIFLGHMYGLVGYSFVQTNLTKLDKDVFFTQHPRNLFVEEKSLDRIFEIPGFQINFFLSRVRRWMYDAKLAMNNGERFLKIPRDVRGD